MTDVEFHRLLKQFEQQAKHTASIEALRKEFREEHKVIYVKTYTVQAHLRRMPPRKRVRRLRAVA